MNYKLPITEEKFILASIPKQKKVQTEKVRANKKGEIAEKLEGVENPLIPTKSREEEKLDYYLNLIDRYSGKTIDELAKEKYEYEYQNPDKRTDTQLSAIAHANANAFKQEKQTALTQKTEEKVNDLEKDRAETIQDANEKVQKIETEHQNQVKQSKDGAIKKGLARSSIIANLLKQYESEALQKNDNVRKNESLQLKNINDQITTLEEGLKSALSALDMETAVKLNDELTRLKEERNKANEKVALNNAKVDKKIQEYANELIKTEEGKAIKELIENKGGKYMNNAKSALIDYLNTLSKEEAYAELEREDLNRILGSDAIAMVKRYLDMQN